jgi:Rrf2 family protein
MEALCNYYCFMKKNSRISVAIHSVLHLSMAGKPVTSEELGRCQNTNPVLIRRILGDLKKAGIVDSEKGHGGGWIALKSPATTSFQDILQALQDSLLPKPIKLEKSENCLIMKALCTTMDEFLEEADSMLSKKLAKISIQDLIDQI